MIEPNPMRWRPIPQALTTRDPRVLDLSWADRGVLSALFSLADDGGRWTGHLRALAGRLGWHEGLRRLESALGRLEASGLISRYEVDGAPYGEIVGYLGLVALSWKSDPVYPAAPVAATVQGTVSGTVPGTVVDTVDDRRTSQKEKEKEKNNTAKQAAPQAGVGTGTGTVRETVSGTVPGTVSETVPPMAKVSEAVTWPSPQVKMAVRQWRGQLAVHQRGQRDIPEVTDVSLLALVEKWGAEVFERAVVRHVGETVKAGRWLKPWEALRLRCEWAATDEVEADAERIVRSNEPVSDGRMVTPLPAPPPIVGAPAAWWPAARAELRAAVESGSDFLTWLAPLAVVEHEGVVTVVCPDSAHATMVQERFGGLIEAALCLQVSGPIVFGVSPDDSLTKAVA